MAALIALPAALSLSVGVAGAAVGLLSLAIALLVVPALFACSGRGSTTVDPPRAGGLRRVRRLVSARAGRHAPPGAVALGSTALLLAVASPLLTTRLTGPSAEAVPPGHPSYDGEHVPRTPLSARGERSGDRRRRRARERRAAHRPAPQDPRDRRSRARRALRPSSPERGLREFRPARTGAHRSLRGAVEAIRALAPPGAASCSSQATPRASSIRRAASSAICRSCGVIA